MMNRRRFLRTGAGAAGCLLLPRRAYPFVNSPTNITKFAVTLPGLGKAGKNNYGNYIPVATAVTGKDKKTDYYSLVAKRFKQQLHPNLPETTFWGYADTNGDTASKYLGGVIVATRGRPVQLKMTNQLTGKHPLPVDKTLMGAEKGQYTTRITVHLHGGFDHWTSDGGPFSWFDTDGTHGPSFLNGTGVAGQAVYDYPNEQSGRLLLYHDHALGVTRLNAYAGLASAYVITDSVEAGLVSSGVIPSAWLPLIIQDKTFKSADDEWGSRGDLAYPSVYESDRWTLNPGGKELRVPSCVPEFFSDIMLVNGAPYPTVTVDPARLRLRVLNICQARFLNLQMYVKNTSTDGITPDGDGNPTNPDGPAFIQIGTEGGLLPNPVAFAKTVNGKPVNSNRVIKYEASPGTPTDGNAKDYNLLMGPAERADLIIDFSPFQGQTIILYNDAPAPFPGGDDGNDYRPSGTGAGPDTRIVMQFVVRSGSAPSGNKDFAATLTALKTALPKAYNDSQPNDLKIHKNDPPVIKSLNEDFDEYGRLRQRLGTMVKNGAGGYGQDYLAYPTEIVKKNDIQVWRIFNLTGDTHPMHFHLVNVQVLQRAKWSFDSLGNFDGKFRIIPGTERPPDPNEAGWKETVRMNPGEATDVVMKFDLPAGNAPDSPRLLQDYKLRGAEYVWHCHILEHEEHDMMRPLVVT